MGTVQCCPINKKVRHQITPTEISPQGDSPIHKAMYSSSLKDHLNGNCRTSRIEYQQIQKASVSLNKVQQSPFKSVNARKIFTVHNKLEINTKREVDESQISDALQGDSVKQSKKVASVACQTDVKLLIDLLFSHNYHLNRNQNSPLINRRYIRHSRHQSVQSLTLLKPQNNEYQIQADTLHNKSGNNLSVVAEPWMSEILPRKRFTAVSTFSPSAMVNKKMLNMSKIGGRRIVKHPFNPTRKHYLSGSNFGLDKQSTFSEGMQNKEHLNFTTILDKSGEKYRKPSQANLKRASSKLDESDTVKNYTYTIQKSSPPKRSPVMTLMSSRSIGNILKNQPQNQLFTNLKKTSSFRTEKNRNNLMGFMASNYQPQQKKKPEPSRSEWLYSKRRSMVSEIFPNQNTRKKSKIWLMGQESSEDISSSSSSSGGKMPSTALKLTNPNENPIKNGIQEEVESSEKSEASSVVTKKASTQYSSALENSISNKKQISSIQRISKNFSQNQNKNNDILPPKDKRTTASISPKIYVQYPIRANSASPGQFLKKQKVFLNRSSSPRERVLKKSKFQSEMIKNSKIPKNYSKVHHGLSPNRQKSKNTQKIKITNVGIDLIKNSEPKNDKELKVMENKEKESYGFTPQSHSSQKDGNVNSFQDSKKIARKSQNLKAYRKMALHEPIPSSGQYYFKTTKITTAEINLGNSPVPTVIKDPRECSKKNQSISENEEENKSDKRSINNSHSIQTLEKKVEFNAGDSNSRIQNHTPHFLLTDNTNVDSVDSFGVQGASFSTESNENGCESHFRSSANLHSQSFFKYQ